MILSATGHRPIRAGLNHGVADRSKLEAFAHNMLSRLMVRGLSQVNSGGAQGWDQAVAVAARQLAVPYTIAVPFSGQESKWPAEAQEYYRTILAGAHTVITVSPGGYAAAKFAVRDRWLVENADVVLALCDDKPEKSGTRLTMEFAQAKGLDILNVWSDWLAFRV